MGSRSIHGGGICSRGGLAASQLGATSLRRNIFSIWNASPHNRCDNDIFRPYRPSGIRTSLGYSSRVKLTQEAS